MAGADHPPGLTDAGPGEHARRRLLEELRRAPAGLGVQELADRVGLHVNTVRFHLDRLLAAGQVNRTAEPRDRPGRPRLTFTAAPGPQLHGGRRDYRLLAEMLTGLVAELGPDAVPRAAAVGRRWGASLARTSASGRPLGATASRRELLRVLDEVGFAPELTAASDGPRVLLRHCPFLEAAQAHPDVVCSMHRGLMDGTLAAVGAPIATDRLVPFAEPGGCVAHLVAARSPGVADQR